MRSDAGSERGTVESGPRAGEDRVLLETKALAGFIIPFLVAAFVILFLFPHDTERLFAWGIGPQMNAMVLGATYLTGVFFFSTVILARRWQQVKFGFIPVATFAGVLGVSTIIHWEAFTHDHVTFWLWAGLYFTTPFLVLGAWLRNTRVARLGRPGPGDLSLPRVVRAAVGIVGLSGVAGSFMFFVFPGVMIDVWPWTITALTSRVLAAVFAVFSVFALAAYLDPRWESLRLPARSQLASPVVFLIAMVASWGDLDTGNPLTWVFAFNVVVVFTLGLPAMYVFMERRRAEAEEWTRVRQCRF